jgi:hypothetical protein
MDANAWIGPVIIASAIAAMVNVLGWFVSSWRDRRAEERRRLGKQSDIATALMAEITHYRDALTFFDLDEVWESVTQKMAEDHDYMPFIPSERNDTIFSAILADIHILPEPVIQPVTRYYNQVFAIDAIIDDLRAPAFKSQPHTTWLATYTDYISLKKQALVDGDSAIHALSSHLSVSRARATLAQNGAR